MFLRKKYPIALYIILYFNADMGGLKQKSKNPKNPPWVFLKKSGPLAPNRGNIAVQIEKSKGGPKKRKKENPKQK